MYSDIDTDRRPFVLIWEMTQACELACEHCRADARPSRHPAELTTREAKQLLTEASEFGDGQLLVLSGGDPLVRSDVVELVEFGTRNGLRMTITPSGTTSLTPDRIEELAAAGIQRMALSLDGGSADAHDTFRGEAGSFEETVAAAEAAREADIPIQINTTVCASTVDELPAIRDLVDELGAVLWSVFFLVPIGRGRLLEPIDPERAESVMAWLYRTQRETSFGIKTTEAPHYRRVALAERRDDAIEDSRADTAAGSRSRSPGADRSESPNPKRPHPPNGAAKGEGESGRPDAIGRRTGITAGDGFAFVSHTGELYPSGFLPESAGNVRDGGLVERYRNAESFEALREKDALGGKCGVCEYRHVCGGSRSRAYAYTGDPLASDPLCAYVPEGYDGPMPQQRFDR